MKLYQLIYFSKKSLQIQIPDLEFVGYVIIFVSISSAVLFSETEDTPKKRPKTILIVCIIRWACEFSNYINAFTRRKINWNEMFWLEFFSLFFFVTSKTFFACCFACKSFAKTKTFTSTSFFLLLSFIW